MVSIRSNQRGAIVLDRHEHATGLSGWGRTLALPLMVLALAGCGGAEAADASSPAPSAATSSAPVKSLIQQASNSCHLDTGAYGSGSAYATIGDAGYTITLSGSAKGRGNGLTDNEMVCALKAVSVPDRVVSEMDATRALDGMQRASWDKMSASWTYHPDDGLQVILTESK